MKSKMLGLVFALLAFGGVTSEAQAVCGVYAKVRLVYAVGSGANNYSYFYLTPVRSNFSDLTQAQLSYYVFADNSDSQFAALLRAASNNNDTVLAYGDASSCPSPSGNFVNMGRAYYAYKFHNF